MESALTFGSIKLKCYTDDELKAYSKYSKTEQKYKKYLSFKKHKLTIWLSIKFFIDLIFVLNISANSEL